MTTRMLPEPSDEGGQRQAERGRRQAERFHQQGVLEKHKAGAKERMGAARGRWSERDAERAAKRSSQDEQRETRFSEREDQLKARLGSASSEDAKSRIQSRLDAHGAKVAERSSTISDRRADLDAAKDTRREERIASIRERHMDRAKGIVRGRGSQEGRPPVRPGGGGRGSQEGRPLVGRGSQEGRPPVRPGGGGRGPRDEIKERIASMRAKRGRG